MSMKKWTDEELVSTRDNLESWNKRSNGSGSKMWLFTAILGAFAVSTGVVFIFFDGIDAVSYTHLDVYKRQWRTRRCT